MIEMEAIALVGDVETVEWSYWSSEPVLVVKRSESTNYIFYIQFNLILFILNPSPKSIVFL